MRGMGWNINFGVIFGGERSVGDLGYQNMIKNDFISAVDQFEEFIDENPRHMKKLKAQKMLEFCKKQKPYQEFENGNNAFDRYDLDQAARWYEGALRTANEDLSFEIIVKQKELAVVLLDSALIHLEGIGFNKAEKLIRKAKALTPMIENKADKYLSELYLRKGDIFFEVSNFEVALRNYEKAYLYDNKIVSIYINRVKEVTDAILDEANDARDKGDMLFALSSLKKLIELRPDLKDEFRFGVESLEEKLQDYSSKKTQERLEEYIESEKNRAKKRVYQQVEVGMSKEKIVELMGQPAFIENKYVDNEVKQLWFYFDDIEKKYIKFYFENDQMMRIDQ